MDYINAIALLIGSNEASWKTYTHPHLLLPLEFMFKTGLPVPQQIIAVLRLLRSKYPHVNSLGLVEKYYQYYVT